MWMEQSKPVRGETVPLSRRQKRDLLELAAAGALSAIFFAAPAFLIKDAPPRSGGTVPPPVTQVASASPSTRVQIATADVMAPVSTPALQAVPRRRPSGLRRPAAGRAAVSVLASSRERAPLGRRIARLFAGDGSHAVHPFPTIPSARR